jgi:hypothetical protein
MNICQCKKLEVINGEDATQYSKNHLQKIANHGGWIQLWKCPNQDIYFEASWIGGEGFYNGVFIMRRLSNSELIKNWPEYSKQ